MRARGGRIPGRRLRAAPLNRTGGAGRRIPHAAPGRMHYYSAWAGRDLTTMQDKAFYQRVLDNQHTALLLLDARLNISYLNAAAEVLLYASRRRLLGRPLTKHFTDRDRIAAALGHCLENGHPFTFREVELRGADDRVQRVDFSATRLEYPVTDATLLIEIQPVGQLVRIFREKGRQQAHLATRQLVRGVAHELKNPLGGIRGAAQLLASEFSDGEWQEYLDVIIAESNRLRDLADQMLGMRRPPAIQPVNVHECLERVRQIVQAEYPSVPVERDYDPSLPEVSGDHDQLVQALLNIVRNAMQVLAEERVPDGRIRLRTRARRQITIKAKRRRLALCVEVEDNGPGIPEPLREALFFPMVTGRPRGTGLGLPIAQDIASQHEGQIECDSRPGYTCFSLLLPVRRDQAPEVAHHD